MRFDFIFLLVACIAAFMLGCFVYFKNRKNIVNKTWGFFSLNFSIWSFGYALMIGGLFNKDVTLFWARFSHFGAILIPVSVLHFYSAFLGTIDREMKKLVTGYIVSLFLLILNFTPLFIKDIVPKLSLKYYFEPGIFYSVFTLMFFIYILYEHFVMFKAHRESSGFQRNQIKYILLGSIIGFFGGATTFPLVFDIPMPPFGITFIFLYPIIISYAIVKYNLMGIEEAFKKLFTKVVPFLFIAGSAFILIVWILEQLGAEFSTLSVLLSMVTMAFIIPLIRKTSALISRRIRPQPDFQTILKDYTEVDIMTQHTSKDLAELVVKRITDTLQPTVCSLMLLDKPTGLYNVIASSGKGNEEIKTIAFKQSNHLISGLRNSHQTRLIVKDELNKIFPQEQADLIRRDLEILKSQISIPLILKGELFGLLNLGIKTSGGLYTPEEMSFIYIFLAQSTFMMQFLDKIRAFHELEVKAEKLSGMTNLLVGFEHEINNQLIPVQTFFNLSLEKLTEQKIDLERLPRATQEALDNIQMILNSVHNYLEYSETKDISQTNIKERIKSDLFELKPKFAALDVKIATEIADNLPSIETYPTFYYLFGNIFTNSYYALKGRKTRLLDIKAYQTKDPQRPIEIVIKDTGGDLLSRMDEEALSSGGDQTPERSTIGGINYFIAKHIIEDHQGELIISTNPPPDPDEPPGTVFTIKLPLKQPIQK